MQLEPDERKGVDALQLVWNREDGSRIEWVSVGGRSDSQKALGFRLRTHVDTTDLDFVLADYGSVRAVGFSAAGQWGLVGWRVEATTCNVPRYLRVFVPRSDIFLVAASKPSDSKTHDLV